MPRRRFGVVLPVPVPWATELDGIRRGLRDGMFGRIPAHITLVPPVNVAEEDVPAAIAAVRRAAAVVAGPLEVDLGPATTFLPVTPTVHLAVGGEGLAGVHRVRDAVFVRPLARALDNPFVPHVTLADHVPEERIAVLVESLSGWRVMVPLDRLALFEEGAEEGMGPRLWEPVVEVALGRPAVIGRGGWELELTETAGPEASVRTWADAEWARFDIVALGATMEEGSAPVCLTARRSGGQVVGLARGSEQAGVTWLDELLVGEHDRGTGVGGRLLDRFVTWSAERGAHVVGLRAQEGTPAEAFYRSRGFEPSGPARPWYHGAPFLELSRVLH